jgi:hypothetical protein
MTGLRDKKLTTFYPLLVGFPRRIWFHVLEAEQKGLSYTRSPL